MLLVVTQHLFQADRYKFSFCGSSVRISSHRSIRSYSYKNKIVAVSFFTVKLSELAMSIAGILLAYIVVVFYINHVVTKTGVNVTGWERWICCYKRTRCMQKLVHASTKRDPNSSFVRSLFTSIAG